MDTKIVGGGLYKKLDKLPLDNKYQVMCYNCNFAKGNREECPHKHMDKVNEALNWEKPIPQRSSLTMMMGRRAGKTMLVQEAVASHIIQAQRQQIKNDGSVESIMEQWQCYREGCDTWVDDPISYCRKCAIDH